MTIQSVREGPCAPPGVGGGCPIAHGRGTSPRPYVTVAIFCAIFCTTSCAAQPADPPAQSPATIEAAPAQIQATTPQTWTLEILDSYAHDPSAYTQGLVFIDDDLWESTGNYGASTLRLSDFGTGEVLQQVALPNDLFGEGLAAVGDELWQLTWYAGRLLRWSRSLEPRGEIAYAGQGWGLCHDGDRLWRSDGSGLLYAHDPQTFAELERVQVRDPGGPVRLLNELECVDGLVYANIYTRDEIVVLDPARRVLVARIDASALRGRLHSEMHAAQAAPSPEALNGIAYHRQRDSFFLTGKYWPRLFEVRFVKPGESPRQ